MNKYIYFSKKIRVNRKKIQDLISEDNEGVFWYVHLNTPINVEAFYYNNKSGTLKEISLYRDVIDNEVISRISYTENSYIQVSYKTYDDICIIKINSLIKYIEIIGILNEGSDFVFRGQKNKVWSLTASIFRKNYDHKKEYNIYKEIKKNRFNQFTKKNFLDSLIHMQHYGIPTRLLDWSKNPLIPLFFACSESDSDGRVFAYKPTIIYGFDSDDYNNISCYFDEDINLSRLSPTSVKLLVSILRGSSLKSVFIESSYKNERLRAQNGLFSIFIDLRPSYAELIKEDIIRATNFYNKFGGELDSNIVKKLVHSDAEVTKKLLVGLQSVSKEKITESDITNFITDLTQSNYWDTENNNYETNLAAKSIDFIIPNESKSILRAQLEILNISSMTVFPDSFGFVQYINDKYER